MVNLETLKKKGITDEHLKSLFTADEPSEAIKRLKHRVWSRANDGILNNFRDYKLYYAIDQAWNVPFRQVTSTLVQALASKEYSEDVFKAAQEWKLAHLITEEIDEKTGIKTGNKRLSLPTFFNIFVPLVRAYVTIRAAKLTGDRNLVPYFKFEPTRSTAINRARCEIITDRIEAMTTQLGYRDIGRQAILKMLLYSVQLMFIQEEWWKDEQENEDGSETLLREGLRYHLPHPTRTYWDHAHPLSSLNSDTGVEFCGYWRVRRYRDVRENMHLWNTDKIKFWGADPRQSYTTFFNTVYGSCTLHFPQSYTTQWGNLDREKNISDQFYNSAWDDSALVLTEHFEKVHPKRDGIGNYKHPVWFRFVMGGDGTILYASPLPGHPAVYWGYDPDEAQYLNASLALEVLPFQDQVSNLLTQALLSVKQNLANLSFVDSDVLDEETIKKLENTGESWFRRMNIFRYSGRQRRAQQQNVKDSVAMIRFPQLDVPSLFNAINAVLGVLERVLVMSAQEIAGQATHEQSKAEIMHVRESTSTRLGYTSMQVDRAWDSWKRQLYTYLMAFGAAEIYAQLSQDPAYTPELLTMLGFTFEITAQTYNEKHFVKGPKSALQLEYFSATRDGNERTNDTALAQAMLQMLTAALQNPILAQSIGPEQSIMLVNQVLEQMGLPRDFKLRPVPAGMPAEQQQQMMQQQFGQLLQQVQQFIQQNQQEVMKAVGDELKPLAQAVKEAMQLGSRNEKQIARILDAVADMKTDIALEEPPANQPQSSPKLTIGGPAE